MNFAGFYITNEMYTLRRNENERAIYNTTTCYLTMSTIPNIRGVNTSGA